MTIFEKIIAGELPCHKIYEDEMILAFLDINPVSKGHTLVIPKKHFPTFVETDVEYMKEVIATAQKIAQALLMVEGIEGVNIAMNNGEAAGQVVFHTHMHIIPRYAGDGLKSWPGQASNPEDLAKLAKKIAGAIK